MDGDKKPARLWPLWCAVVLLAVFVAYPLSAGPVGRVLVRMDDPPRWLEIAYEYFYFPPAATLEQLPESVQGFYWAYVQWCYGWGWRVPDLTALSVGPVAPPDL